MIFSYIRTAFRNLRKYKGYSFINIAGLAVGIACCILIILWVRDELSYDGFHGKADRLYRIVESQTYTGGDVMNVAVTPAPLAPAIEQEFPEIEAACRFTVAPRFLVRYGDNVFYESGLAMADPPFWTMFSFPLVQGDPEQVFRVLNSFVVSESMAEKYFGDEDPIGKTVRLENMFDLIVTGVMADVPKNSHIRFDFVMPFKLLEFGGQRLDQWGNNSYTTYIELKENTDRTVADEKFRHYLKKYLPESTTTLHLQPIRRIHLHSDYVADFPGQGDIRYITIFSLTALLVLIIACINFMNLATARSGNRAREVGMRKVTGALRTNLIYQFLGESVVYALLAFVLAMGLTALVLPAFGNLAGKTLSLGLGTGAGLYPALIALAILTGLGAGLYPALYLSRFDPVRVLKGSSFAGTSGKNFRRILVVFQFTLSIGLIIISLIVQGQLSYIHNKPLGFVKDNVVYSRFGVQTAQYYEAFKTSTLSDPDVLGVTTATELPTYMQSSTTGVTWQGKNPDDSILFHTLTVTHDYFKTMGMSMADGRPFSKEYPTDLEKSYIINETAARLIGEDSPVGKPFTLWEVSGNVIGVVKDFHFSSLTNKVAPLVIRMRPVEPYTYLLVRLREGNTSPAIERLISAWKQISPHFPFDYSFLDDSFDELYRSERRLGTLFAVSTGLIIFIACLGLLGLASFMAEKRTREIGIRKVLGASVPGILVLLSKEFVILVTAANFFAWPVAYLIMRGWLRNYAYNTGIHPFIFIGAAVAALLIALLTISFQAFRAAAADPIDSLRYE